MDYKHIATAGLSLLERVNLTGKEVNTYILINQMLGHIREGKLVVSSSELREVAVEPDDTQDSAGV